MYTLRKYTDKDYEFVYQVKKDAYIKYVEEIWGKWIEDKQREYFDSFISKYGNELYIIEIEGKEAGIYNGEILKDNSFEIGNICIVREYQNLGYGTKILKDILEQNKDKVIRIQCFKSNPVKSLYLRLGFEFIEENDTHYKMIKNIN